MSLKNIRQSLLARPSSSSNISDFPEDNTSMSIDLSIEDDQRHSSANANFSFEKMDELNKLPQLSPELKFKRIVELTNEMNLTSRSATKLELYLTGSQKKEKLSFITNETVVSSFISETINYCSDFDCFDLGNLNATDFLFLNSFDRIIALQNEKNMKKPTLPTLQSDFYSCLKFINIQNTPFLATGTYGGNLSLFDMNEEKEMKYWTSKVSFKSLTTICNDNLNFYVGNTHNTVLLYDIRCRNPTEEFLIKQKNSVLHNNNNNISFIRKKDDLLLVNTKDSCKIFDLKLNKEIFHLQELEGKNIKHDFSPLTRKDHLIQLCENDNNLNILTMKEKKIFTTKNLGEWSLKDFAMQNKNNMCLILCSKGKNSKIFISTIKNSRLYMIDSIELGGNYEKIKCNEECFAVIGKENAHVLKYRDLKKERILAGLMFE